MKPFTHIAAYIGAVVFIAAVALRGEPRVEPRFDQSVITADFEGDWAELPVESTGIYNEPTETIVFKAEEPVAPVLDTAPQYSDPLFVSYPLFPTGRTMVFGVAAATGTDIVLLDNGYDQGFRTGMLCEITNAGDKVGEIILVEVRADRAAGLITQLEDQRVIRFGDAVRIKTAQYL